MTLSWSGEDIWRYVGKLTDAQKSMMDDRFKWKVSGYLNFSSDFSFLSVFFFLINFLLPFAGPRDGKKKGRKAR